MINTTWIIYWSMEMFVRLTDLSTFAAGVAAGKIHL